MPSPCGCSCRASRARPRSLLGSRALCPAFQALHSSPRSHTDGPHPATCLSMPSHSRSKAHVKAKTLREKIVTTVSRKSHLMTDELASYEKIGKVSWTPCKGDGYRLTAHSIPG